ncbi:MAG: hypothetical protein ACTHMC_15830 [Pseudobacter sp.]|uniref:hypothetical protein n=1 Tax=Pseudobacter sp. TaxID=2045420 RepID=UPI003F7E9105
MDPEGVIIRIAGTTDEHYAAAISEETERSAIGRGSGISKRPAAVWEGCRSCVNYNILQGKQCKNCLCTAMLFTPAEVAREESLLLSPK